MVKNGLDTWTTEGSAGGAGLCLTPFEAPCSFLISTDMVEKKQREKREETLKQRKMYWCR